MATPSLTDLEAHHAMHTALAKQAEADWKEAVKETARLIHSDASADDIRRAGDRSERLFRAWEQERAQVERISQAISRVADAGTA